MGRAYRKQAKTSSSSPQNQTLSHRRDSNPESFPERDEALHPGMRRFIPLVGLVQELGIAPSEQFIIDILRSPQVHFEGEGMRERGGRL
jgi:hypothetical protein